jgi:hypothetical protein
MQKEASLNMAEDIDENEIQSEILEEINQTLKAILEKLNEIQRILVGRG